MICPEDSVFHCKTSSKRFFCFWVYESNIIFSRIFVLEKCVVSSHSLDDKDGGLPCWHIGCTRNHMVHSEGILSGGPDLFGFSQVFSVHQDVSQSESPLESELCFLHGVESCFMNSKTCLRHACECANDAWEADSGVRDGVVDVPDEDNFVLVDAAVGLPVEVAHGVKFSALSLGPPGGHEGAMNTFPVHEVLEVLDQCEHVVFYEIDEMRILDP